MKERLNITCALEEAWPLITKEDEERAVYYTPVYMSDETWKLKSNEYDEYLELKFEFDSNEQEHVLKGKALTVMLSKAGAVGDQQVSYLNKKEAFAYSRRQFPVKFMDRLTRKIFTVDFKRPPNAETSIGAKPINPYPTLSESVALEIPKQNP